jgi:hypothetical protein
VGFLITLPLMIGSLVGGYLYAFNPVVPWAFTGVALALSTLIAVLYIRDPETVEA